MSNGRIGYSAVAVTGGLVGIIGGLYFYSKKKGLRESRRLELLSTNEIESNLLVCH